MLSDQKAIVESVIAAHPEFHQNPDRDAAKAALLPYVVAALNGPTVPGNWGVLVKTDQGGKVPNDIVCWRQTREIVDVLTDTGALWDYKGVAPNDAWIWMAAAPVAPPIVTPPTPNPDPSPADIEAVVQAVASGVGRELLPVLGNIYDQNERLYAQNERILANLTAQNLEILRRLAGAQPSLPEPGPTPDGGLHLTPEAVGRIADVAGSVFARRKK